MATLQDQLLKVGIIDAKKAKKIKQEQRKKAKQQPKGSQVVDETKELAKQALANKAAKAKQINQQQQEKSNKKAVQAQIIQLINNNKIDRGKGEVSYQFTDDKKIKKLYVTDLLQDQLSKGLIAIAKLNEGYEIVPAIIADKITQRDENAIVLMNIKADLPDENDPYANYAIPDDLMW
ncbi:MAG: hypothetical protein ACJA0N_001565 [Pseudohongiellaceae bacterium]|jgi:uncharacterized protein YaiL (DUF2058 family)